MSAKSFIKIEIPTKRYLKKYLMALYGSPLVFNSNNYFGTTVIGYLEGRFSRRKNTVIMHKKFDVYDTPLIVCVPRSWLTGAYYNGVDLPDENVVRLNKHFEERFEEDVVRYCYCQQLLGVDIKDALESFCNRHGIDLDDDINYDTLKKKEYRARMKFEKLYQVNQAQLSMF